MPIPTNKPVVRVDQGDLIYKTEDAKFDAVVDDLEERYERGQPVLVGTVSVEKSEQPVRAAAAARASRTRCSTRRSTRARARSSPRPVGCTSITVATNMAGRGVDIILGGNPEGLAAREVLAEGLDPDTRRGPAALPAAASRSTSPRRKAEGDKVRELGGLYVLGTERHESRRIDNQLRGRSGRQGDPGESRFYLSLEDELMRLFATGAMSWVMGKALPDDVPIEAKMVIKAIERAQSTVEARNAEIRKNVLKYDEVLNEQRKVIYRRRDQILEGDDLRDEAVERGRRARSRTSCAAHAACRRRRGRGTSRRCVAELREYYPTTLTVERPARHARRRRHRRRRRRRGDRALRGARGRVRRRRRCARSSAR